MACRADNKKSSQKLKGILDLSRIFDKGAPEGTGVPPFGREKISLLPQMERMSERI